MGVELALFARCISFECCSISFINPPAQSEIHYQITKQTGTNPEIRKMELFMHKMTYLGLRKKKWSTISFLSLLMLGILFPSFDSNSTLNLNQSSTSPQSLELVGDLDSEPLNRSSIHYGVESHTQSDPEAYFPNFLYYSVEIANALVDHLFDNSSGGFYGSADAHWQASSINTIKRSYDNAQAILAFLKLADAVINQTERDFAIEIAVKTANYLLTSLYDDTNNGFFISDTNQYRKPGNQAKAIQAFLALYEITGNETYRQTAIDTYDYQHSEAWNETKGYYAYLLSDTGKISLINPNTADPYTPTSNRVDHNVLMGNALLDLYQIESDEKYLTTALRIFDTINGTCRNSTTHLFYTGVDKDNWFIEPYVSDSFINSLVLEFLADLYNVTEETKYYDDFFLLLNSVMTNFWDNEFGAFYATYSYNNEERDDKKYTERQFYAIRALDKAYEISGMSVYYNIILDVVEILTNKLYDAEHSGYNLLTNRDGLFGDPAWEDKLTVTQTLAIFALSNLWLYSKPGVLNAIWSPSTPRPQDPVTIMIAAFDADGISNVFLNYSIDDNPYELVEMVPDSRIGNMYNTTIPNQYDGADIFFNIIVNDTLGNYVIRATYYFLWQFDEWAPIVTELGFEPGYEIPINTQFSITVSAQDVPIQGEVKYLRIYYHLPGQDEKSVKFVHIAEHLWTATFPEGLGVPGTYAYYYEVIDFELNFDFDGASYFYILGHEKPPLPFSIIIGLFAIFGIFVPAGLYTYVEYKKKSARRTLKGMRRASFKQRGGKRRKRRTQGKQRTKNTMET
ncbi:hypothetical protein CEE45_11825 [Candidatus Heimdallarchaeota archaeon B3_Heim]|nr:MAG: hypothetical protein CEE45_11825 [Candidatus Heimdallarchaeota archaeon B3_Heim]